MAICRSWRCMKKDRKYKRARKENTWTEYDFVNNQVLGFQLKLPKTRFLENFVVTLRNPQFDVKGRTKRPSIIRLPPLKPQINYKIQTPISNSKDCILMVLYEPLSQLAPINRLGKETRWTYIDKHGDEIYPWIRDRKIWAFDSTSISTVDIQLVVIGIADEPQKMYLVGSKKKGLLMIYRFSEYRLFTRDGLRKTTIDDIALFVDDNDSIYVVASMHSGCQSSCIYFVINDYKGINYKYTFDNFEVYNFKSQSVTKLACLRNPVKRTRYPPFMLQPIVYM
ncbi:unnamed protein product [Malus baccata var. baccata]